MPGIFEQEVLPLFEVSRAEWLEQAREVAHKLAQNGTPISIDDVRSVIPPPPGVDPRVMGAVFTRRDWEGIGYVRSSRRDCHNRPVQLFVLRDKPVLS